MRVMGLVVLLLTVVFSVGCADHSVHKFDFHNPQKFSDGEADYVKQEELVDDPHTYKLVEMYSVNTIIPTLTYPLLYQCNKDGVNCHLMYIQPVQQPGVLTGLAPTALQGMAMLGSAEIIRQGLKKSGSTTNNNNTNTSSSSSSADQTQSQVQSQSGSSSFNQHNHNH